MYYYSYKHTIWKQMQQIESLYLKELKYITSFTRTKPLNCFVSEYDFWNGHTYCKVSPLVSYTS